MRCRALRNRAAFQKWGKSKRKGKERITEEEKIRGEHGRQEEQEKEERGGKPYCKVAVKGLPRSGWREGCWEHSLSKGIGQHIPLLPIFKLGL